MPTFHINRSNTLKALLQAQGWKPAARTEIADFGMWAPDKGDERRAKCDVLDREVVFKLDYKLSMYELLRDAGYGHITPRTFATLPEYISYLKETNAPVDCFLKSTHGSNGEEVFYFNSMKLLLEKLIAIKEMQGTAIIQAAVKNPLLIDKRKFKIRIYAVLLSDWSTYLFREGLMVRHKKDFDLYSKGLFHIIALSP